MVIGLSLAGVGVLIPFVTISVHGKPHEVPGLLLYIVHALRMLCIPFSGENANHTVKFQAFRQIVGCDCNSPSENCCCYLQAGKRCSTSKPLFQKYLLQKLCSLSLLLCEKNHCCSLIGC